MSAERLLTLNFDLWAAGVGNAIVAGVPSGEGEKKRVDELQAALVKSLGVLQEQGVYALWLYLLSKRKSGATDGYDPHASILRCLEDGIARHAVALGLPAGAAGTLGVPAAAKLGAVMQHLVDDIRTLLLVRDFVQQSLTYARYSAQAKEIDIKLRAGQDGSAQEEL